MKQLICVVVMTLLSGGCTAPVPVLVPDTPTLAIAAIKVQQRGKNEDNRPNMMGICKGFLLTETQVRDFFNYSAFIKEPESPSRHEILPCYSSGTAMINDKLYHWVIRAGGIGEFHNDNDRFTKICGKACCSKVPGIC
jgi:hypothetical protein